MALYALEGTGRGMAKTLRSHSLVVLMVFGPLLLSAQRYFFENISVQQGLPASKVYCALQDAYGLVWIGTEAGIASYDGNVVQNHGTAEGVARNGVRALLLNKDGHLWAGHLDGGISYYDGNHFQALELAPGMNSAVTGLAQTADGAIWASTAGHGVWRIDGPPTEENVLNAAHYGKEQGIQDKLLSLTLLNDGRLCAVEDRGVVRQYDAASKTFKEMPLPGVEGVFRCTSLFQDGRGDLWVGTIGGGAFRFNAQGRQTGQFDPSNGLASGTVICFGEDGLGQVWIGTFDGGIGLVSESQVKGYSTNNGLHSRFVRCITKDREGNLLIGTNDNGLDIFKGDRFVSFGQDDGLTDPQVWAVMEDHQGRTWFGTDAGIVILSQQGDRSSVETITSQKGMLTTNFVRSLREDDNGRVWIGTENGGLLRFDPRTGKAQYDLELSSSLAEGKVTALEVGQTGELWIGGLNGLRRYIPGSGTVPTVYTEAEGLANNHVVAIFRDNNGAIWVGSTVNGITRIDNGVAHTVDLGKAFTATCFTQDSDGRIWVGTEGQGVIVLENGKQVQQFTIEEGLLSNSIKALGKDQHGHVWIGTNKGLNKWRPKKGGFIAFTERAGFTGIEVKPNAVWTTRKGDLWFGTADGATRVGNEKETERAIAPLVAIRGWKVNLEDRPKTQAELAHDERNIRLAFGSVSLSDPAAVRYQYRLLGLDEDWEPITSATESYYPALPSGKYTFQVKAMDRSGLWSDPPAELHFDILPPWYRSWWFYTLLALGIGIVLFSYIKVRERQLRLRNQVLERKVEERTAEVVAQSQEIEGQKEQIEGLLLNILPKEISEELKDTGRATARRHENVTVMFTDMKGFTMAAEKMTPEELVNELDECFIQFDAIIGKYGIEKIKTIGDSYMCASGVPRPDPEHAVKSVLAAIEVRILMDNWHAERVAQGKRPWTLRIGLHSGPVVAGVVGKRKFAYDIWGDTVNTASRMESSGEAGEVNISGTTYELVKGVFECVHRGQVEAKNKGKIDMYFARRIKAEFAMDSAGQVPNEKLLERLGVGELV